MNGLEINSSLKPEICSYARKHVRFPKRVEFGTYVDITAGIPGDIIKPGDKLRNIPGALEGANYGNHKKWLFLNNFCSMLKSSVYDE